METEKMVSEMKSEAPVDICSLDSIGTTLTKWECENNNNYWQTAIPNSLNQVWSEIVVFRFQFAKIKTKQRLMMKRIRNEFNKKLIWISCLMDTKCVKQTQSFQKRNDTNISFSKNNSNHAHSKIEH